MITKPTTKTTKTMQALKQGGKGVKTKSNTPAKSNTNKADKVQAKQASVKVPNDEIFFVAVERTSGEAQLISTSLILGGYKLSNANARTQTSEVVGFLVNTKTKGTTVFYFDKLGYRHIPKPFTLISHTNLLNKLEDERQVKKAKYRLREFANMSDNEVIDWFIENEYNPKNVRKLPDGEWILLHRLAYTWSVCCGVEKSTMFKYRWCFADYAEAKLFFDTCQNYDDIPEVKSSLRGHRYSERPLYMEYDEHGYKKW